MAKKIEKWQAKDGQVFDTEALATNHDVQCDIQHELVNISNIFVGSMIQQALLSNAHKLWPLLKAYVEEKR